MHHAPRTSHTLSAAASGLRISVDSISIASGSHLPGVRQAASAPDASWVAGAGRVRYLAARPDCGHCLPRDRLPSLTKSTDDRRCSVRLCDCTRQEPTFVATAVKRPED